MQKQVVPEFTYLWYKTLLHKLANAGYSIVPFRNSSSKHTNEAVIRHDVDLSLSKAEDLAEIESRIGVSSTYFVMISSDFYNAMSEDNHRRIYGIVSRGHEIGLHFDIRKCHTTDTRHIQIEVLRELDILSEIVGERIRCISWHMPPAKFVGSDSEWLSELGIKDAYSIEYFTEFKYFSDSMMRWRDPSLFDATPDQFSRIQILTHPVWYSEGGELDKIGLMHEVLLGKSAECTSYIEEICPGFMKQL